MATRQRVAKAAEQVGYEKASKSTLSPSGRLVGLVVPSIRNRHYYGDASLLHDVLLREGYKIILCCHENDADRDAQMLRSLVELPVTGIVHTPCTPAGAEGVFGGAIDIPIIELGTRSTSRRVDVVSTDEDAAMRDLVEHLVGLGHRRIALFTGRRTMFHIQVRASAFRTATGRAGLDERSCPVAYGPSSVDSFENQMEGFLGRPDAPTAAIVANKPGAIGVLLALKKVGRSVPEDFSLVGTTNEDWYAVTTPPITTYEHPFREMGMVAAELLLRRMTQPTNGRFEPNVVHFSGHLIARASTLAAS